MPRTVFCMKLQRESEGLDYRPYPGVLGERIYEHISQQAWQAWLNHQTMLINEYRLNLIEPKSREYLETEMEKFFFSEGSEKPAGYVEEDHDKHSHE